MLWNILLSILLAATLCFIWGNSLLSRADSAELSGGFVEMLAPIFRMLHLPDPDEHVIRKLAHFVEYAVLGLELSALFFLNRGRSHVSICLSAVCAFLISAADETIQLFAQRAAMIKDVLLDCFGAFSGIMLLWLLTKRKKTKDGLP